MLALGIRKQLSKSEILSLYIYIKKSNGRVCNSQVGFYIHDF